MSIFCWPARVYWEDTDGGGVVYYANYLKFLERARTEWLRSLGFSQRELARTAGIVFAVRSVKIDYRRPARLDDELCVTCEPRARGAASLSFAQRILKAAPAAAAAAEDLLAGAEVRIACLDARTFRPQPLPDMLLSALGAQED
ncbi:MAG TPA: tol-pal system-associated acyl-CoA thioesterase [Steroidobacteraceae bacterium]|nr:tol-pal system-associated acyl-CoA thioesterase [Steroidobacteraceae bacterium]